MFSFKSKMAGKSQQASAKRWISPQSAYILLNVLRGFSIFSLCLVVVTMWFIIINSFISRTFFFFDVLSYIMIFTVTCFLIVTEIPQRFLPIGVRQYLLTHWPLLSYTSGLKTLSMMQIGIGIILLGYINNQNDATSRSALGDTWWRMMVSTGAFLEFVALANMAGSIICVNIDDEGKVLSARQLRDPEPPTESGNGSKIGNSTPTEPSNRSPPRSEVGSVRSQRSSSVYSTTNNEDRMESGGLTRERSFRVLARSEVESMKNNGSSLSRTGSTVLKSAYASVPIKSPAPVTAKPAPILTRPIAGEGSTGGRWL